MNYTNEAWHLDRDNVQMLAEWLEGHCYWPDTRSLIAYYEKPDKWKREFGLCELARKHPQMDERCIEACDEMDTDAATVALEFGVML